MALYPTPQGCWAKWVAKSEPPDDELELELLELDELELELEELEELELDEDVLELEVELLELDEELLEPPLDVVPPQAAKIHDAHSAKSVLYIIGSIVAGDFS